MPVQTKDLKHSLSDFLSGAELDPTIKSQCERLAMSSNFLLNVAALGLLLDPMVKLGSTKSQAEVQFRIGLWIESLSQKRLREIERLTDMEIRRLLPQVRDVDLRALDYGRRLELQYQRRLIEAVNRVLLRAKRTYVESQLMDLDDWLPLER